MVSGAGPCGVRIDSGKNVASGNPASATSFWKFTHPAQRARTSAVFCRGMLGMLLCQECCRTESDSSPKALCAAVYAGEGRCAMPRPDTATSGPVMLSARFPDGGIPSFRRPGRVFLTVVRSRLSCFRCRRNPPPRLSCVHRPPTITVHGSPGGGPVLPRTVSVGVSTRSLSVVRFSSRRSAAAWTAAWARACASWRTLVRSR